jgi:hypothetical protein
MTDDNGLSDRNIDGPSGALRYIFTPAVLKRNCLLASIVGSLLTIANQLDVLLAQPFSLRLGTKILFNFLMPFAVSSISAVMNRK